MVCNSSRGFRSRVSTVESNSVGREEVRSKGGGHNLHILQVWLVRGPPLVVAILCTCFISLTHFSNSGGLACDSWSFRFRCLRHVGAERELKVRNENSRSAKTLDDSARRRSSRPTTFPTSPHHEHLEPIGVVHDDARDSSRLWGWAGIAKCNKKVGL